MNRLLRHQWSMSVSSRLSLGLLPSLLAAALVVGLVYWGEYGREAPRAVVTVAMMLAGLSLWLTVRNVQYLVRRFDRVTESIRAESARQAPSARSSGADEFDDIEHVVGQLGSALTRSHAERAQANAAAATRLREQSTLLAALVRDTMARLDDVRMPVHILLETKFGDLNENQEELLRDARVAADALDDALRRLGQVADADRDAMPVLLESLQVNDVVRAILPVIRASAERGGRTVDVQLEPGLSRVRADRARLAEALALLAVRAATSGDGTVRVATLRAAPGVDIAVAPWQTPPPDATDLDLAARLLAVQGGTLAVTDGTLTIHLGG